MTVFQDNNGQPIKFFIQKDLSQEIQHELCETITNLGGRVEAKVPRQGYVLIQLGTPESERLRSCWQTADRPDRHFVPHTFVEACRLSGTVIQQIFVKEGGNEPIKMHIHNSIANVNVREMLSQKILHSGGDPFASLQAAQVILADPNTDVFKQLVRMFQSSTDKYIESWLWVKQCVERGILAFTPLVYKNPGGRRAGEERTQFTTEDEQKLCEWIAAKIPYKETGGRTGNRLYMQLLELEQDPQYAWVKRHTWQSWRERYKKHAERLDAIIDTIVTEEKPAVGERGQYGYVRQPENAVSGSSSSSQSKKKGGGRKGKKGKAGSTPEDQEQVALDNAVQAVIQVLQIGSPDMMNATVGANPNGTPNDDMVIRPGDERVGYGDDESQWAIRVGNDPPPAWSTAAPPKRKWQDWDAQVVSNRKVKRRKKDANEATDDLSAAFTPDTPGPSSAPMSAPESTPMTETVTPPTTQTPEATATSTSTPTTTPTPAPEAASAPTPADEDQAISQVIDECIRNIAAEFLFTEKEVRAFYDRCGDMNKTSDRFEEMRKLLREKFPEDKAVA